MPEAAAPDSGPIDDTYLLNETITFDITVTGVVPPGTSFIQLQFNEATQLQARNNGQPVCSAITNRSGFEPYDLPPTLPATFTVSVPGGSGQWCGLGFGLTVFPVHAEMQQLPKSTTGNAACGCIHFCPGGPSVHDYTGGSRLTSSMVTCNVNLPAE